MELYNIPEDFSVIGVQVTGFPNGIKEAFGSLMNTLGGRDYYGVSWMDGNDNVVYYAMAKELSEGEGRTHGYESFTIKKGEYKTEAIRNWMENTACIKDVLQKLMGDSKPDKNHPCLEWYKSDDEMLCMVMVTG